MKRCSWLSFTGNIETLPADINVLIRCPGYWALIARSLSMTVEFFFLRHDAAFAADRSVAGKNSALSAGQKHHIARSFAERRIDNGINGFYFKKMICAPCPVQGVLNQAFKAEELCNTVFVYGKGCPRTGSAANRRTINIPVACLQSLHMANHILVYRQKVMPPKFPAPPADRTYNRE